MRDAEGKRFPPRGEPARLGSVLIRRKKVTVERLIRGEDLELLSRKLGVTACTLKENLLWVRSFTTVEELRQALLAFKDLYNRTLLIERHGFKSPSQARQSLLETAA